jgi:hypothetical protein
MKLEESFRALVATYDDRVEEYGKKLAAERQQNFDTKSKLLWPNWKRL